MARSTVVVAKKWGDPSVSPRKEVSPSNRVSATDPDPDRTTGLHHESVPSSHDTQQPRRIGAKCRASPSSFKDKMARGGGGQAATDVFVMRADGSDVRRWTDDAAEEGYRDVRVEIAPR